MNKLEMRNLRILCKSEYQKCRVYSILKELGEDINSEFLAGGYEKHPVVFYTDFENINEWRSTCLQDKYECISFNEFESRFNNFKIDESLLFSLGFEKSIIITKIKYIHKALPYCYLSFGSISGNKDTCVFYEIEDHVTKEKDILSLEHLVKLMMKTTYQKGYRKKALEITNQFRDAKVPDIWDT